MCLLWGGRDVCLSASPTIQLRAENMKLLDDREGLKLQVKTHREQLARTEEKLRTTEHELRALQDSHSKILRGLNTQTEIAIVQLKRDFENMRKQLLAKDEIITVQERKIASLIEANSTLRSGLQDLLPLSKELSESEEEGEAIRHNQGEPLANGHHANASPGHNADLHRIISILDSGKFDQS